MVRHLQKLEHELEIIRQSDFLDAVPLKKRLEFLEGLYRQEKYSIYELCEAVNEVYCRYQRYACPLQVR